MRKITLYLFLFTYATVMFKPVMPYVTDLAAHLLFYKDHMLTVHSHHGKFHVHTAITEGAKNDQSEKSTNNSKEENPYDQGFYETYQTQALKISPEYYNCISIHEINTSLNRDYPPPRS